MILKKIINFSLKRLSVEESWRLFEVWVDDELKVADFHTIATQLVPRCGGFPALIVTIAKSLRNKGIHPWEDTLNNL